MPNDKDCFKKPLIPPGKRPRVIKSEGIILSTVWICQEMEMCVNVTVPFLGGQSAFAGF